jgi:hypothetical protein
VFVGTNQGVFGFDTLSDSISVLSSQGIIELDGIYYWVAGDRFMQFNGVVQEIPNELNLNFFFDNVNMTYRQKVFAFAVPRWGEIWWCFPMGTATDCNHAVIYNYRYQTWYDTPLPGSGRTAGYFASPYAYPIMTDLDETTSGFYTLWNHEIGTDQVIGPNARAVRSYYQTSFFSVLTENQPVSKALRVARIEPDFKQSGEMSVTVMGQANARATNLDSGPFDFTDTSSTVPASDQLVDVKTERRLLSFQFESNVVGGDYLAGRCIAHVEPTEGRVTQ